MAAAFFLIMTAAFYATAEYNGGLPVLPVGIRYVADVLVIGMGLLWILVTADFQRIRFLYSVSMIMMVPIIGIGLLYVWEEDCFVYAVRVLRNGFCDFAGPYQEPWSRKLPVGIYRVDYYLCGYNRPNHEEDGTA
ncbi:hypothetical protein CBFG_01749 [Clostridiales bacterium 1_7_47FAA]|nr:hypothetical protein CBFG_01749 [Clostridiales bacterium 1_7_47FAA]